jgi:hypothetical protein
MCLAAARRAKGDSEYDHCETVKQDNDSRTMRRRRAHVHRESDSAPECGADPVHDVAAEMTQVPPVSEAIPEQEAPEVWHRVSSRRKLASIVLGVVYGECVIKGIERGLEFVHGVDDLTLHDYPYVYGPVWFASVGLAGFLATYSSRSLHVGAIAAGIASALSLVDCALGGYKGDSSLRYLAALLMCGVGVILGSLAFRLQVPSRNLATGRLFDISWWHWIWLFIPWQWKIAEGVWLAYPIVLLGERQGAWPTLMLQVIRAPVYLIFLAWTWTKALKALQAETPLTRKQSALRFLAWAMVAPIVVNIVRLLDW